MPPKRREVTHRSASDEAMDRNIPVQAGFLTLVTWIFVGFLAANGYLVRYAGMLMAGVAPVFCYFLTLGTRRLSARLAAGMIGGLTSAGNIKYQNQFSLQESMVARGRFDDAVESFRAHLAEHPDDIPARYRLATLHLRERKDPAAAEEEFFALRRRPLDPTTTLLVSNHLIDLYRATGQRGRLMAELTRMMNDHAGTPMGAGAAKLLEEVRRAP